MIRIIVVALWIGFTFSVLGQTQPNPFDLQYRPRTTKKSSLPVKPKHGNDSTAVKKEVVPQEEAVDQSHLNTTRADTALFHVLKDSVSSTAGDNPFDVKEGDNPDSTTNTGDQSESVIQKDTPATHIGGGSRGLQTFFLLLSLLFLIFIVNVERNFVKDLWRVISNENYSSLHLRNQRNTMRQILLMMGYAIFIFQAGIFFFHLLIVFDLRSEILDNIWTCITFVLIIYLVRHMTIRYLRWLFNNEKEMTLFGFDISIFNIMVGLILLPINVILNFGPESMVKPLIIIGVMIIALAYLMRQLRWMLTARHLIVNSLFLFFVYLCAVEILPLWAISKFFW